MSRKTISHDAITIISKKKKEATLFIVITLVVLIVLIAFPIRLMAISVININKEVEGKRRIRENLDTKITNLTQLNTQYQEIRENLVDFPLVFPSQGDYSLFVANLEEVCKANYFRLESVSVSAQKGSSETEVKKFEVLNVWEARISVVGRRSDIVDLLEKIEAMPMYPSVINFSYINEIDDDGFLKFSILLKLYGVNKQGIYLDI